MYWTFRVSWAVVFGSELISRFMPYISHMSRIKTHKTWENPQEIHLQMVDFPFCHVRFCFFWGGRRLYGIYDCHWWKEPWNSWWWNFHLRVPSEGSWKSTACGPSGGGNVRGFCERNQLNELWNYWSPQLPRKTVGKSEDECWIHEFIRHEMCTDIFLSQSSRLKAWFLKIVLLWYPATMPLHRISCCRWTRGNE